MIAPLSNSCSRHVVLRCLYEVPTGTKKICFCYIATTYMYLVESTVCIDELILYHYR